ncbi:MAG TPA: ThiF family adenylyltransferase, partial [Candidatus Xenobia bacterium]
LEAGEVIVDAFDNHEARRTVAEHCRGRGVPCLHAGLSRDGYAEVVWNEAYRVPPDAPGDGCQEPVSRTLSLLVVAVAAESLRMFLSNGTRPSFTITVGDLKVTPI